MNTHPNNHRFINRDPLGFDGDCAVCGGKFRDCVHIDHETCKQNPTAVEVGTLLTQERHAAGLGIWPSPAAFAEAIAAFAEAIAARLRKLGIPNSPAQYDEAGNCLTCGECGRCPGVHTFEEILEAARAEKGNTP